MCGSIEEAVSRLVRRLVACGLVGTACRPVALVDVPVRGGTPEQRAAVEGELRTFAEDIAPEALELHSVRIEAFADDDYAEGRYRNQRVHIDETLSIVDMRFVTRHELCHALDDSWGWASSQVPSDPDLVAWQRRHNRVPEAVDDQREETFALLCGRGPALLDAMSRRACQRDPSFVAPAAADVLAWSYPGWIARDVFTQGQLEVVASFDEEPLSVGLVDDRAVQLTFEAGILYLDTETETLGLSPPGPATLDIPPHSEAELPETEQLDIRRVLKMGVEGGEYVVLGRLEEPDTAYRVFLRSREGDWVDSSCVAEEGGLRLFATSQVWAPLLAEDGSFRVLTGRGAD